MAKKDEILADVQVAADCLSSTLYYLPGEVDQPGSLGFRAEMLELYAQDMVNAAHDLRQLATAEQEIQAAVQNVKNGTS